MIGSHIVDLLVHDQQIDEVRVVDSFFADDTKKNLENSVGSGKLRTLTADVRDGDGILGALQGVNYVFHLAAVMTLDGLDRPEWIWSVNAGGFFNVLNASRQVGVERVVLSSSTSAYGDVPGDKKLTEELVLKPTTIYGATKASSEALAHAFWRTFGLETVALRYGVVYGPRLHRRSKSSMVIRDVIDAVLRNERVVVFGDGSQRCEWVYVNDVARANIAALYSNVAGESINVGTGSAETIRQVVDTILRLMDATVDVEYKPFDKPVAYNENVMDVTKSSRVLGFLPSTSLEEGLMAQIEYQRAEMQGV
jgi:UDP-glucose 4-epimerase